MAAFFLGTAARSCAIALSALLSVCAVASPSLANGRFPAANHLVQRPGDPDRILLRATFGLVLTRDRGKTWDWVCERAVGYSGSQDPPVAYFPGGNIVATLFEGLAMSRDEGCTFGFVGGELDRAVMVDVALHPDDPRSGVALTGTFTGMVDGGSRFSSRLYATADEGAAWTATGVALDPTAVVETVDVAKSDPSRIYVSAVRGEGAAAKGLLFVSTNRGASWTERPVPLDATTERGPYIAAIDPVNADRVYVRTGGAEASRLFVTDDGGKTFRVAYTGTKLLGFALSPDGSKVFLGGPKEGLRMANRTDLAFAARSPVDVECLMATETTLYACSSEATGFIVGASNDDGATFRPLLRLSTLHGPLACPGDAGVATLCAPHWPALRDQLGVPSTPTATPDGRATGTTTGASASPRPAPRSCGCRVAGTSYGGANGANALGLASAAALVALGGARVRRRRNGVGPR